MKSRIKGIIFDMDGVLLNSAVMHERAFRDVLEPLGVRVFDYSRVTGMRTDEALRLTLAQNGIPFSLAQVDALAAEKSRIARELIAASNPVVPSCAEVLAALSGCCSLALASSASKETVDLFLTRNALTGRFQCVLHGGDVRRAKPEPEIYELACQRLELSPAECLIVEDAVSGVRAGKAAGATVWGIPATCPAQALVDAGADRIIHRLEYLLTLTEVHSWLES